MTLGWKPGWLSAWPWWLPALLHQPCGRNPKGDGAALVPLSLEVTFILSSLPFDSPMSSEGR